MSTTVTNVMCPVCVGMVSDAVLDDHIKQCHGPFRQSAAYRVIHHIRCASCGGLVPMTGTHSCSVHMTVTNVR